MFVSGTLDVYLEGGSYSFLHRFLDVFIKNNKTNYCFRVQFTRFFLSSPKKIFKKNILPRITYSLCISCTEKLSLEL